MNPCPYCQATTKQRYQCLPCSRRYTPAPKIPGYYEQMHQQAVRFYSDGMNFRRIARHLEISHQTVINWINAYGAQLPNQPP